MNIVICIFIALSLFFAFAGVVGILRMPDTFSRMQVSTCITTFGVLGVIIGGILYSIFMLHNSEMVVKLVVLGIFYIITNPIASHALAKGAYWHGVRPEKEMCCDKYGEDLE